MDPAAFISEVREHYLDQFKGFVQRQRQSCTRGEAEVKLRLSDHSKVFRHLYCADFIKNDDEPQVIELKPERVLVFEPISGSFGGAALMIEHLSWDDVVLHHDATEPLDALQSWFERWFDPEDERHVNNGDVGNLIHSLVVQPQTLSIDLGSAHQDALWELLDVLEAAGATSLRITASRVQETGA